MTTRIIFRHICDRCRTAKELDSTIVGPTRAALPPEGWLVRNVKGNAYLVCAACVAALQTFAADNARAEQSP